MGYVPPPFPRIPDSATWEDRLRIYENHVTPMINGCFPWRRKALRERILKRIEDARRNGPPSGSGIKP